MSRRASFKKSGNRHLYCDSNIKNVSFILNSSAEAYVKTSDGNFTIIYATEWFFVVFLFLSEFFF